MPKLQFCIVCVKIILLKYCRISQWPLGKRCKSPELRGHYVTVSSMRICIKPSLLGSRTKMLNFMQCICAWHISIFSHRLPFPSSVDSHYKSIGNNMILIHDCIWFFFNQYINQFELILSVILTNKMILKQRARSNGFSKTFFCKTVPGQINSKIQAL